MVEFLTTFVAPLPILLLWLLVVVLLARQFGVRLPLRPMWSKERQAAAEHLTRWQYMWIVGVLYFGCGMLIFTTLSDYLDWKYWDGSDHLVSAGRMLSRAVLWLIVGFFFGWFSWNGKSGIDRT
jgi:hypothetical protein